MTAATCAASVSGMGAGKAKKLKLYSWNVNGIRAAIRKEKFYEFIREHKPDILGLQETRGYPEGIEDELPDYEMHWNHAEKKGYSGTALFLRKSRTPSAKIQADMGKAEHDREGRILYAELPDAYVLTVYTPNSGDGLKRLEYRQEWDRDFRAFCKKLAKKKPLIVCGDLNVAHQEIDIARPKENRTTAGFTDEERSGMTQFLKAGFLDTFRALHPETRDAYSWWSFRGGARERNVGWRIDYFCVSEALRDNLRKAWINPEVHGSDHCPVGVELQL